MIPETNLSETILASLLDQAIRLQPSLMSGEITDGKLTVEGALISGWITPSTAAVAPFAILVYASGEIVSRLELKGEHSEVLAFEAVVPKASFRPPLYVELTVYAIDASGGGGELPMKGTAEELGRVRVGSRQDFLKLVQSPTERVRNNNLLFYVSYHALDALTGDFAVESAAICVMGYRLLDGLCVPEAAVNRFWAFVWALLEAKPQVSRGLWLRWHTSVRLIGGYVSFYNGDTEKAAEFFEGIGEFAFELAHWPAALTNVLIGVFLAGWTRYERGEFADAVQAWRRAEGILRYGGSIAQFPNFYAYGELGNAIKIAQECYVGCLQAENGGCQVEDARILPTDYCLDIRHLPALLHNLGIK